VCILTEIIFKTYVGTVSELNDEMLRFLRTTKKYYIESHFQQAFTRSNFYRTWRDKGLNTMIKKNICNVIL
jgi:hypothetical protein